MSHPSRVRELKLKKVGGFGGVEGVAPLAGA